MTLAICTSHPIQYQAPLWRALSDAGADLSVWFLTRHGVVPSHDREFGSTFSWDIDLLDGYKNDFLSIHEPANMAKFTGVRIAEDFADRLKREKVTHLWVEGWRFLAFWQVVRSARKQGVEVWMRGESNDLKVDRGWKRHVKSQVLRRHFHGIDRFLAIGSANRRFYANYGVADSQVVAAPYCVDNDRFVAQSEQLMVSRSCIRERWGIAPDAKVILFCGKLIEKKHPMDLVRAAQLLHAKTDSHQKIHLLFVGSGTLKSSISESLRVVFDGEKANGSMDSDCLPASFTGFLNQSELSQAYVAADLLVLPSDSGETWGLVVNEAMACGVPAVVSDLVGCAEDLPARLDPALVYPFGDIEALAKSIVYALNAQFTRQQVQTVAGSCHLKHTVATVQRLLATPNKSEAKKTLST